MHEFEIFGTGSSERGEEVIAAQKRIIVLLKVNMRTKKPKTTGQLKKQAWDLLSKCIRIKAADDNGICECVTCGDRYFYKGMHAGHFIDGRHGAVLFDERAIWVQCLRCNVFLKGNKVPYTLFMLDKFGKEVVDELLLLGKGVGPVRKWTRVELMELIEQYRNRLDNLNASFAK